MGKAFVAKLAAEGAHNPEALAAWIGRKKHGKAAFAKLSAAGRKTGDGKGGSGPSKPSAPRPAAKKSATSAASPGGSVSDAQIEGGRRQARAMSDRQLQGIKQGLVGKRDERSRVQRQVINDEIKRRREQGTLDAATAKERAQRQREKGMRHGEKVAAEMQRRADEEAAAKAARNRPKPQAAPQRDENGETDSEFYARIGRGIDERRARQAEESIRNAAAGTRPGGGFSPDEERRITATAAQTRQMNMGQLQGYEEAYRPNNRGSYTREDALRHEAIKRELKRREKAGRR